MLTLEEFNFIKNEIAEAFDGEVYKSLLSDLQGGDYDSANLERMFLYHKAVKNYVWGATDNRITKCELQDIYSHVRQISACGEIPTGTMFSGFTQSEVKYKDVFTVHIPVEGVAGPKGDKGEKGDDGTVLTLDGQYRFEVQGGDLVLVYADGSVPPEFSIVNGELILSY